jgi:large subunit ribosomal protein L29
MKTSELRQKSTDELRLEIIELQKAYFGLRMKKSAQKLKNVHALFAARRQIARAKTILAEKQRAEKSANTGVTDDRN